MSCLKTTRSIRVTILTLAFTLTLIMSAGGCAYIEHRYAEPCKTRAYIGNDIPQYLSSRFHSASQVRMAIIPYSVPANVSYTSTNNPDLGYEIAQHVQSEILPTGLVPIVEVFNRNDWPGQREQFYAGNFDAINFAREAGYDLVLTGTLDPIHSLDTMSVATKVIEVESGITIYYGKASVTTQRPDWEQRENSYWLGTTQLWYGEHYDPSQLHIPELVDGLGRCIVHGIKQAGE